MEKKITWKAGEQITGFMIKRWYFRDGLWTLVGPPKGYDGILHERDSVYKNVAWWENIVHSLKVNLPSSATMPDVCERSETSKLGRAVLEC